jgi:hypothetical protein
LLSLLHQFQWLENSDWLQNNDQKYYEQISERQPETQEKHEPIRSSPILTSSQGVSNKYPNHERKCGKQVWQQPTPGSRHLIPIVPKKILDKEDAEYYATRGKPKYRQTLFA